MLLEIFKNNDNYVRVQLENIVRPTIKIGEIIDDRIYNKIKEKNCNKILVVLGQNVVNKINTKGNLRNLDENDVIIELDRASFVVK